MQHVFVFWYCMQPKDVVIAALGVTREIEKLLQPLKQANTTLAVAVRLAKAEHRFSDDSGHGEITSAQWVVNVHPPSRDVVVAVYHFPTQYANLCFPYPPFPVSKDQSQRPGEIPSLEQVKRFVESKQQAERYGPLPLAWSANLLGHPGTQFNLPCFNVFPVRTDAGHGADLHSQLFPQDEDLCKFLTEQANVMALVLQLNGVFLLWQGM
jgi:hypothetical protein